MIAFYVKYQEDTGNIVCTKMKRKGFAIPAAAMPCPLGYRIVRFLIGDGVHVSQVELEKGVLIRTDYPRLLKVRDDLSISETEYKDAVSLKIPNLK